MKHLKMSSKRLLGIMFLFGAVGSLMISSSPMAFANSPTLQGAPGTGIVKNSQGTVEIIANNVGNDIRELLVLEHSPLSTIPLNLLGNVCPPAFDILPTLGGADPLARQWVLALHPTDPAFVAGPLQLVGVTLAAGPQGKATIPFGPSGGAFTLNAADLTNAGDTWTIGTTPGVVGSYVAAAGNTVIAYWTQTNPVVGAFPADDTASTATAGTNWRVVACGAEGASGTEQWQGPMQVILPVGGTVLPVSAVSLFVAGISNSALLLLPLAGVAAGAFALLRFQVNKKED